MLHQFISLARARYLIEAAALPLERDIPEKRTRAKRLRTPP